MRCKKHPSDLSSTIGVCASCLRHRLFSLIQSQHSISDNPNPNSSYPNSSNPNHPPPLIFPRSVSPYISRRKPEFPTATSGHSSGKFGLISKLFRSRSGNNKGMSPESERDSPASGVTRPSPGRFRASPARLGNVASVAFWLSPLVRASPARHWNGEAGFSGEIRVPANRSRKLADYGRLNRKR